VELYARVRRAVVVDKMSEREAARQFGLARETVRKMLRYSVPPGYRRQQPVRRPKLDAWVGTIDQILEQDKAEGKKQPHTAKRIFERLRDEHSYTGGYTIVKDYVRLRKLSQREMFVPLEHPPGDAQADFGEAMAVIDGVKCKAHYLVVDLPQSDDCFVMAFPAETTEAFLEGHNHAFAYFGGVPRTILYDNSKIAVARILGDGSRVKTRAFTELQSHYLFAEKFGRPGKGNDKGKVEGLVGTRGGTSWCRFRVTPAGRSSTRICWCSLRSGASANCGDTRRALARGSKKTGRDCCRCLKHRTKPARRARRV
jgi:transposase